MLAVRQVLLVRLDDRVAEDLQQEVEEFEALAAEGVDPEPGRPFGNDVKTIFDTYLERNVPDDDEELLTVPRRGTPQRLGGDNTVSSPSRDFIPTGGRSTRSSAARSSTPGGPVRYVAIPVEGENGTLGTFAVAIFTADEREQVDEAVQIVAAVAARVLLLGSVVAFSIVGRVLAPLSELRDAARSVSGTQMGRPDPGRRATTRSPSSRGAFNRMLDRLTVAFASQREFIRDVSHELRTPIAVSRGHLELLAEGHLTDERERREAIALVTGELDRMNRFVEDLLLLAKAESPDFLQLETVPLAALTDELVAKAAAMADRALADRRGVAAVDRRRPPATDAGGDEPGRRTPSPTPSRRRDRDRRHGERRRGRDLGARHRRRDPASEQRRIFSALLAGVRAAGPLRGHRHRAGDRARDRRGARRPGAGHAAGRGRVRASTSCCRSTRRPRRGGRPSIEVGAVKRILIVEDEPGMASFIDKGLAATATRRRSGRRRLHGDAIASDDDFDLVILDLGLPDIDGLSVLREMRRRGERMPVIVLTARDDLTDKVDGARRRRLDYVTKPFKLDELLARVRVQLRDERRAEPTVLEAGGITLDVRTRKAMVDGEVVDLTAREFTMLETFMGHAGQVLSSREQLLAHVWGYDYDPGSNVVEVYVRYLRRKLGEELIETVRGMGYRLPSDT